jgi:phosphatidate cytidylyltransferase
LYTGYLLAFAADLASTENALGRVMTLVLLTSANDTGGYFAGIMFGRHPMVPTISPKKSWEGFAGSVVLAMIIGDFAVPHLVAIQPLQGALFGVLMACSATAGDLIESAIKRDAGIKDSGTSIPGHGGFLDRIDSQLLNAPVAWVALTMVFGV